MHARLYAELASAIERWTDEHCDGNEWPDTFTGAQTIPLMTKAAAAVFDSTHEVQVYLRREGILKAS